MKLLSTTKSINNGSSYAGILRVRELLDNALAARTNTNQKEFTSALTSSLRVGAHGWSATEFKYTSIQPTGRGHPRAIDFFHIPSKTGIELELSNQTCFSHDLLKMEVAFREGLINAGVILTVASNAARQLGWKGGSNKAYLNFESADTFLGIFAPAITVPVVLLGFET